MRHTMMFWLSGVLLIGLLGRVMSEDTCGAKGLSYCPKQRRLPLRDSENKVCYDPETEFCCGGRVYRNRRHHRCCIGAGSLYHINHEICCGDRVRSIADDPGADCCIGRNSSNHVKAAISFNRYHSICCSGQVHRKLYEENTGCCAGEIYDMSQQICCSNTLNPSEASSHHEIKLQIDLHNTTACCEEAGQFYNSSREACDKDLKGIIPKSSQTQTPLCNGTMYNPRHQMCCNNEQTYNPSKELCCSDGVRGVSSNKYGCCGTGSYRLRKQICCDGVAHSIRPGRHKKCCGSQAFRPGHWKQCCYLQNGSFAVYNSRRLSCCGGKLLDGHHGCCNGQFYNKSTSVCCGNRVLHTEEPDLMDCCHDLSNGDVNLYNIYSQSCCRGQLMSKGIQRCGEECYDPSAAICCRGTLYPSRSPGLGCCGTRLFNSTRDLCCGFIVHANAKRHGRRCLGHGGLETNGRVI